LSNLQKAADKHNNKKYSSDYTEERILAGSSQENKKLHQRKFTAHNDFGLELPQFVPETEAFYQWENADYEVINLDEIVELIEGISVKLETETEEAELDELQDRITDLLLLYKTRDPNRYTTFFSKGGGIPDPVRVEKYIRFLKEKCPDLDDDVLKDPVIIFQEHLQYIDQIEPKNPWESIAVKLSKCKIYKAGGNETLSTHVNLMPNKGVYTVHLRWQYPRSTEEILQGEGLIKYASVVLQIEHAKSKEKFPLTFLFYWDSKANTWQLKEGYESFARNPYNCIVM